MLCNDNFSISRTALTLWKECGLFSTFSLTPSSDYVGSGVVVGMQCLEWKYVLFQSSFGVSTEISILSLVFWKGSKFMHIYVGRGSILRIVCLATSNSTKEILPSFWPANVIHVAIILPTNLAQNTADHKHIRWLEDFPKFHVVEYNMPLRVGKC